MERNKVLENLYGLMEEYIEDNGEVENKMEEEYLYLKMEFKKLVFGVMVRKLDGLIDILKVDSIIKSLMALLLI